MKLAFVTNGDSYFTLQYKGTTLQTATILDDWILNPKSEYPNYCYFIQGQNAGLVDGVTLTGATSGAQIQVGRVILTAGTLAGSTGVGILFYRIVPGSVPIATGENLQVSSTTYCVSNSIQIDSPVGQQARGAFIQAENNNIRFTMGNATPTSGTGTPASFGNVLFSNTSMYISGAKNLNSLQMIYDSATSNDAVNVIIAY